MRTVRILIAGALAFTWLASVAPAQAATPGLSLSGNQFLWAGQPFVPHGFNSVALLNSQWCTTGITTKAAANFTSTELSTAKSTWHANTLRFQVSQPVLAGSNGAAYAQQIQSGVTQARAAGFVVDLSMQDQSLACGPAQPLPSPETEAAWTTLITNTTLAADPGVMFELFNEPNNQPVTTSTTDPQTRTWVDWQNGGRLIQPSTGDTWTAYTPVGHQDLVNLMRSTLHVTGVLIADGSRLGEHLEGLPLLTDPGPTNQIAYGIHPYFYTDGQSAWDSRFGYLSGSQALLATEWNYQSDKCGTTAETMAPTFLAYMRDNIHVGILGHALDVFNGQLMADTALDPTQCGTASPGGGYDFLNSYMNTLQASQPTVSITAPANGQTLSGVVGVSAAATPTPGNTVQSVGYGISGPTTATLATITSAPYTYNWDTTSVPDGSYTFTATTTDSSGATAQSSVNLTITNTLAAPTGLTVSSPTTTSLSLSWTASSDPAADPSSLVYTVYRDNTAVNTTAPGATTFTDTGLHPSTSYSYTVTATTPSGRVSAPSAALVATTATCPAPLAPASLTVTNNSPSGVSLSWAAVAPPTDGCAIDHYVLTRNGALLASVTTPGYTDAAIGSAAHYIYSVYAVTADNITGSTASITVTTPDSTAPSAPTNLKAMPGTKSITLTWTAATDNVGVAGYYVYRNGTKIATVSAATTKYTNTSLKTGSSYSYYVVAYDAAGNKSPASNTATAKAK